MKTRGDQLLVFAAGRDVAACAAALEHALVQAGLEVTLMQREKKVLLVVSAGPSVLNREAEYHEYLARRTSDGKVEPFVEDCGDYATDDVGRLWTAAEEATLLWSAVERVGFKGDFAARHHLLPDWVQPERRRVNAAYVATTSFVDALLDAGVIAEVATLHAPEELETMDWRAGGLGAPVEAIARYFGSETAMYFAWMHHFTSWVAAPGIVGAAVYCMRDAETTVDDDAYAALYSLFVVLWGAFFAAFWRRAESERALNWRTALVHESNNDVAAWDLASQRRGFKGELRMSTVTGATERWFPAWKRAAASFFSFVVTVAMLAVAASWHVVSLNLQGYVTDGTWTERLIHLPSVARFARPGAVLDPNQTAPLGGLVALVPTVLHVAVVQQLNAAYRFVAERLVANENHETDRAQTNALIGKRFLFEFFDAYVALFYLAFVQFDVDKLRSELVAIYTVDSFRRLALETLLPFFASLLRGARRTPATDDDDDDYVDDDRVAAYLRGDPDYDTFDDFLEMVIEFGYVTLFAAAFPLGAACSVVSNVLEVKSDVFKLLRVYRRPQPRRVATMGAWATTVQAMSCLAVMTNCAIFASSDQMASWMPALFDRIANQAGGGNKNDPSSIYAEGTALKPLTRLLFTAATSQEVPRAGKGRYVVLIAVLIEHVVAALVLAVATLVPPKPDAVRTELARVAFEKDQAAIILKHARQTSSRNTKKAD